MNLDFFRNLVKVVIRTQGEIIMDVGIQVTQKLIAVTGVINHSQCKRVERRKYTRLKGRWNVLGIEINNTTEKTLKRAPLIFKK